MPSALAAVRSDTTEKSRSKSSDSDLLTEYRRPLLGNKWSIQENDLLIELFDKFPNQWEKIASYYPERTVSGVKQHYFIIKGKGYVQHSKQIIPPSPKPDSKSPPPEPQKPSETKSQEQQKPQQLSIPETQPQQQKVVEPPKPQIQQVPQQPPKQLNQQTQQVQQQQQQAKSAHEPTLSQAKHLPKQAKLQIPPHPAPRALSQQQNLQMQLLSLMGRQILPQAPVMAVPRPTPNQLLMQNTKMVSSKKPAEPDSHKVDLSSLQQEILRNIQQNTDYPTEESSKKTEEKRASIPTDDDDETNLVTLSSEQSSQNPQIIQNAIQYKQQYNKKQPTTDNKTNDKYTLEEDFRLMRLVSQYGNQWTKISQCLTNRSTNSIKRHWALLKSRYIKDQTTDPNADSSTQTAQSNSESNAKDESSSNKQIQLISSSSLPLSEQQKAQLILMQHQSSMVKQILANNSVQGQIPLNFDVDDQKSANPPAGTPLTQSQNSSPSHPQLSTSTSTDFSSKKEWSQEETELLLMKILEYGKNWKEIVRFFPGRNTKSLMHRFSRIRTQIADTPAGNMYIQQANIATTKALSGSQGGSQQQVPPSLTPSATAALLQQVQSLPLIDPDSHKPKVETSSGKIWSYEEQIHFVQLVEELGKQWSLIAEKLNSGRSVESLKTIWRKFNKYDPNVDDKQPPWPNSDVNLLINLVKQYGETKWITIQKHFPNRDVMKIIQKWNAIKEESSWTPDDDALLIEKYREFGPNFQAINQSFPKKSPYLLQMRLKKLRIIF